MQVPPWPQRPLPDDKTAARALARALPPPGKDAAASEKLLRTFFPQAGQLWAVYKPLKSETSLGRLADPALNSVVAYVRAQADHSLVFVTWDGVAAWTPDALKMDAPPETHRVDDGNIALVCVPGLAFGPLGQRLGRGAGCYDRTLGRVPAVLRVAVTSENRLYGNIPVDAHDLAVDLVITESRVHWTGARGITAPDVATTGRVRLPPAR